MKDIYSPSQEPNDDSNMSFQPVPLEGATADGIPELNFDIPLLDDTNILNQNNTDLLPSYGEAEKSPDTDA